MCLLHVIASVSFVIQGLVSSEDPSLQDLSIDTALRWRAVKGCVKGRERDISRSDWKRGLK